MKLKQLRLQNFRNYSSLSLEFHSGVNFFIGDNGQGKTNLLEAVYFLVRGQSFRPGKPDVLRRQVGLEKSPSSLLWAEVLRGIRQDEIQIQLVERNKRLFLNQKKATPLLLAAQFPSVLFSPESLAAIKEGPDLRRQLIDDFLLCHSIKDSHWVQRYRHCLAARNRVLRDAKNKLVSASQTEALLDALDEIFLTNAVGLTAARIEALNVIGPLLQQATAMISPEDLVDISVDYEISSEAAVDWDRNRIQESLSNRLKTLRKSEIEVGTSLVGPHKHDLHFLSAGNDARYFCSQGQQRAIILGFKMAQIMYHYRVFQVHPLLLLDDVLSELDPQKGHRLLKFLEHIKSQIFLTSTDIAFPFEFAKQGMAVFKVNGGIIEELRKF